MDSGSQNAGKNWHLDLKEDTKQSERVRASWTKLETGGRLCLF